MKTRKFVVGAPLHIYFRARGGCVLFYRMTDRLCFCSVLAVLSKRYKVTVIAASLMFTHIHLMVRAADLAQLRMFMSMLIRVFSRLLREDRSLDGPRFETPFGSAPKVSLYLEQSCREETLQESGRRPLDISCLFGLCESFFRTACEKECLQVSPAGLGVHRR